MSETTLHDTCRELKEILSSSNPMALLSARPKLAEFVDQVSDLADRVTTIEKFLRYTT